MPGSLKTSRTQVWFDTLGEWSWPGRAAEAVEALPPRLGAGVSARWSRRRPPAPRRLRRSALRVALAARRSCARSRWCSSPPRSAALCTMLAVAGPQSLDPVLERHASRAGRRDGGGRDRAGAAADARRRSHDHAGSSIDTANYHSAALGGTGSFHVYLPPGYASSTQRYPVLYLLHGNEQPATAFLQLGLQGELDTLIARARDPAADRRDDPGRPGANNWRDRRQPRTTRATSSKCRN